MKKILPIIALIISLASMAAGTSYQRQRSTRPRLIPTPTETTGTSPYDTVSASEIRVRLTGYEKPLKSRRESLFVANDSHDTIQGLCLSLTYHDLSGNMLHNREVTVLCAIPPGQRRQVDFQSWDRQMVFYYIKSAPSRPRSSATPFTIEARPLYILLASGSTTNQIER